MPDNVKKESPLFRDSGFIEQKVILEAAICYIKNSRRFSGSLLEQSFITE